MVDAGLAWTAPNGFLTFSLEDATESWCSEMAETIAPGSDGFAAALMNAVLWCRAQDEDMSSWFVLVDQPDGVAPQILGVGSIDFGPELDVEAVAASWRGQLDSESEGAAVRFVSSKRSPLALMRRIELEELPDGRQRYIEEGRAMKLFRRAGVTGTITFVTSNLIYFDDLTEFLEHACADFVVEGVEHA